VIFIVKLVKKILPTPFEKTIKELVTIIEAISIMIRFLWNLIGFNASCLLLLFDYFKINLYKESCTSSSFLPSFHITQFRVYFDCSPISILLHFTNSSCCTQYV
jgi:hypothetical protein